MRGMGGGRGSRKANRKKEGQRVRRRESSGRNETKKGKERKKKDKASPAGLLTLVWSGLLRVCPPFILVPASHRNKGQERPKSGRTPLHIHIYIHIYMRIIMIIPMTIYILSCFFLCFLLVLGTKTGVTYLVLFTFQVSIAHDYLYVSP